MLDKELKKWMKEYLLPTAKYSHNGKEPTLKCNTCENVIRIGDSLYYETTGYTPYCEDRDCTEGVAVYETCLEPCWWEEDEDFWKYWDKLIKERQLDTIKDELFIYLNDAISEYIGKYDLMLGDISNELDKKYSKGYNLIAESVYEQIKESEVE